MARTVVVLLRLALAGIFIYAGWAKLYPTANVFKFMMDISSYRLLPEWSIEPLAYFLPPFEIVLGLWLLTGWQLRFSALASGLLLCGFWLAMFITYMRGIEANCGCGFGEEPISPRTLTRDGAMVVGAAFLMVYAWRAARRRTLATPATA
ncbi:MAG TPA: MauE/DoxX family redox-associated membrane protein [Candidatus Xenobia bacterium]|nr:MauE/DoxX family redox-associated membrane protein [Candidatus Xenobia bacterium]